MTTPKNTNKTEKSYEAAIDELEKILTQLESSDLPLEEAIKEFESGVSLIKHCQGILDKTEQKIKGLTATETAGPSDNVSLGSVETDSNIPF